MAGISAVELEIERIDAVIKAAEDWSKQYKKDPETFASLIKVETRMETMLRRYFKGLSERAPEFINWFAYEQRLREIAAADDFTVDVLISDTQLGLEDNIFIQTMFDPVSQAVALGMQTGEKIYSQSLGISQSSAIVQRTAKDLIAELVGKRIDENGNVVDNPRASYRISDKTRKSIRESIATSISLGENQIDARARIMRVIKDPRRAEMIARTEAVNAYQRGMSTLGKETGAVGKEWQSSNDDDICGSNSAAGIIKLNEKFPSGHMEPAAHPNCRCGMVLIYPEDPRAKLVGKGAASLNPDWKIKKNELQLKMFDGNTYPYEITATEKRFIKDTALKIRPGTVRNRTLGYYTPSVHTLTIGDPAKHVFYHELGHAIDYRLINNTGRISDATAKAALEADKKTIAMNRLRDGLRNMDEKELAKYVDGLPAKYKTASGKTAIAQITPKYRRYMYSRTELFAEAYRQYRLDPSGFAKQAPAITEIIKGLGL